MWSWEITTQLKTTLPDKERLPTTQASLQGLTDILKRGLVWGKFSAEIVGLYAGGRDRRAELNERCCGSGSRPQPYGPAPVRGEAGILCSVNTALFRQLRSFTVWDHLSRAAFSYRNSGSYNSGAQQKPAGSKLHPRVKLVGESVRNP